MDIRIERPPNFEAIKAVFPVVGTQKGIMYCWDTIIYNPDDVEIPKQLIMHEMKHSVQQQGKPDEWWQKYLAFPYFRFEQELEAHREEYQAFCAEGQIQRNQRRLYLTSCARRLSGPLYGNCVAFENAKRLIKGK